jgi:2-oxoglutarate dehydrogenase E1 component
VAGQGIVAETLNFSQLPGYRTGGTVHFVINNQIGFTTDPQDARSTRYCTDVAKMIEAPVFHVNGDDPEAVCMVAQLALDFRVRWKRDVFIDMYCFRRHGHNETDEPSFTQPMLYKKIAAHPLVSALYTEKLVADGTISTAQRDAIKAEYSSALEENLAKAKDREASKAAKRAKPVDPFKGSTAQFQPAYHHIPIKTGITAAQVDLIVRGLTTVPSGFKVNPKIKRLLDARVAAHREGGPVDWGFGEALAFGSLLIEGRPVRLSGQDCERGTFSHRHAVLTDIDTGEKYTPLKNLAPKQARFCVYNSLLSEAAVLGFDYGYSLDYPDLLCLWEAQFGDFANGAQVVIDQFIVSGESKWQRTCGIVLLLPHGYEGQGPEHSSARLERFLQSCAEDNIQVVNVTTPAQFFHLLRRQVMREFRKPLIAMSPKSLLRHPGAVSRVTEFTDGAFQEILDDSAQPEKASRVILCSGKIYYDLLDYRVKNGVKDTALIRIEQLYPLHTARLGEIASKYEGARLVWCQEESQNMGAWSWICPQIADVFRKIPLYAGRGASASPAVGSLALHKLELAGLLEDAYTL